MQKYFKTKNLDKIYPLRIIILNNIQFEGCKNTLKIVIFKYHNIPLLQNKQECAKSPYAFVKAYTEKDLSGRLNPF